MQDVMPRLAAREVGVTIQSIYSLLWAGRLRAKQDATGRWRISRSDLELFKKQRADRRKGIITN